MPTNVSDVYLRLCQIHAELLPSAKEDLERAESELAAALSTHGPFGPDDSYAQKLHEAWLKHRRTSERAYVALCEYLERRLELSETLEGISKVGGV